MKDENHKEDLSAEFDKALQKDLTITKAQIGDMELKNEGEDLWARVKQNIRNIRKRRRRRR